MEQANEYEPQRSPEELAAERLEMTRHTRAYLDSIGLSVTSGGDAGRNERASLPMNGEPAFSSSLKGTQIIARGQAAGRNPGKEEENATSLPEGEPQPLPKLTDGEASCNERPLVGMSDGAVLSPAVRADAPHLAPVPPNLTPGIDDYGRDIFIEKMGPNHKPDIWYQHESHGHLLRYQRNYYGTRVTNHARAPIPITD